VGATIPEWSDAPVPEPGGLRSAREPEGVMPEAARAVLREAARARREGRWADARADYREAVRLCREGEGGSGLVEALAGLGQVERDLGHGELALPLYEEAVAICRTLGDVLTLAHTVRHLGDIHRHAGRRPEAESCYLEALALYRGGSRTPPLDLANAIRPLAILKEGQGEAAAAIRLWEEARNLYGEAKVEAGVAECARRLAHLRE
jgi:tetratricopeptide (TPR) repeat protein